MLCPMPTELVVSNIHIIQSWLENEIKEQWRFEAFGSNCRNPRRIPAAMQHAPENLRYKYGVRSAKTGLNPEEDRGSTTGALAIFQGPETNKVLDAS